MIPPEVARDFAMAGEFLAAVPVENGHLQKSCAGSWRTASGIERYPPAMPICYP